MFLPGGDISERGGRHDAETDDVDIGAVVAQSSQVVEIVLQIKGANCISQHSSIPLPYVTAIKTTTQLISKENLEMVYIKGGRTFISEHKNNWLVH